MQTDEWAIEYYVDDSGRAPVGEFFRSVDRKTYVRILAGLEHLRLRNVHAREPLVKHLEGKLWELRESSAGNIYRVIYVFMAGRRIVLLHGFQKKSQALPRRDLETARQRYRRLLEREGGEAS